jgi:hypothetical protein
MSQRVLARGMSRRVWSADDDAILLAMRREKKKIDLIARELDRTPGAVSVRLNKLYHGTGECAERGQRSPEFKITRPSLIDAFLRKPAP